MRKIFTIIASAFLAMSASAQEKYAVPAEFTPEDNQEVQATSSITLKYGADGAWKQSGTVGEADPKFSEEDGFVYYVVGNNNPKTAADKKFTPGNVATIPAKGTTYSFTASQSGTLEIAIKLNSGKIFYIADTADGMNYSASAVLTNTEGTAVALDASLKVSSPLTGFAKIDILKDQTLMVFCDGSKLSFFGFKFTPGEVVEDTGTPHEAQAWDFTANLSETDKANIAADTDWEIIDVLNDETGELRTKNYKHTPKFEGGPATANGVELELTKGLKFQTGAGKFEYFDGERLTFGGNGHGPIIPDCAKDDVVRIRYRISEGGRGFEVGNLEVKEGVMIGEEKDTYEVKLAVKKKGDANFSSVAGADLLGLAVNAELPDNGLVNIKTIHAVSLNEATYSLSGQKVNDAYKGLVLKAGRKFVQK